VYQLAQCLFKKQQVITKVREEQSVRFMANEGDPRQLQRNYELEEMEVERRSKEITREFKSLMQQNKMFPIFLGSAQSERFGPDYEGYNSTSKKGLKVATGEQT
jgi:hypothetical protein